MRRRAFLASAAAAEALSRLAALVRPIADDHSPRADAGYTGWVVTYLVDEAPVAYLRGYYFGLRDFYLPA